MALRIPPVLLDLGYLARRSTADAATFAENVARAVPANNAGQRDRSISTTAGHGNAPAPQQSIGGLPADQQQEVVALQQQQPDIDTGTATFPHPPPSNGNYGALPPDQQQQITELQEQWDLATAAAGETEHEVQEREDLDTIAAQYDLTREDILLTNPQYADREPEAGDTLIVLHDADNPEIAEARLEIAREMAGTDDPVKLAELVAEDIYLATFTTATPADSLEEIREGLLARRPGDDAFREIVDQQSEFTLMTWQAQGRTRDIFVPLMEAVEAGDWESVEDIAIELYATYAVTNPNAEAIANPRDMLLTYGPDSERYTQAIHDAEQEFLVERPAQAADEVQRAFDEGGPLEAARKLRELTDPQTTDPLTAASIFEQSAPVLDAINDDPALGVYTPIFGDLSAAADSANRSGRQETQDLIARLAGHIVSDAHYEPLPLTGAIESFVGKGNGVVLPLEIAKHLQEQGRTEEADLVIEATLQGVDQLEDRTRDEVHDLAEASLPLVEPLSSWEPFIGETDEAMLEEWFSDHPDEVDAIDAELEDVNVVGYELTRALAGLDEYKPFFEGSSHHGAFDEHLSLIRHIGPYGALPPEQQQQLMNQDPGQDEPELSYALSVSEAGLTESLRQLNMDGVQTGELFDPYNLISTERSQTIADLSWSSRMLRNHVQADIKVLTGDKPANVGLSLYGVGTYIWGVGSHGAELGAKIDEHGFGPALFSEDGWRNAGFIGMYAAGVGIEGAQVASAGLRNPSSNWSTGIFNKHLQAFGWWNVIGTGNYLFQGDWARAAALGPAAGGTLWSTTLTNWGAQPTKLSNSWFGRLLKVGRFGGPIATLVTLAGSAALWGIDQRERVELANKTEPFNEDFLVRNGVSREIARELANNDGDGLGTAPRLYALADHLGIEPGELLTWLEEQDPEFVGDFVKTALHPVKPDDNGSFPPANSHGDLLVEIRNPDYNRYGPGGNDESEFITGNFVGITEDGLLIVEHQGHQYTELPSNVQSMHAQSLAGMVLWAELSGHPLPAANA